MEINHTAGSICRTLGSEGKQKLSNTWGSQQTSPLFLARRLLLGGVYLNLLRRTEDRSFLELELRAGAPYGLLVAVLVESIAEGGDNRVGLHFCPFLRALGQTITMLDHYVNYPQKTTILTKTKPYLRSRPLNSDMYYKQDGNKTPPIVVG